MNKSMALAQLLLRNSDFMRTRTQTFNLKSLLRKRSCSSARLGMDLFIYCTGIIYKYKNHFNEMKGDVGMSDQQK